MKKKKQIRTSNDLVKHLRKLGFVEKTRIGRKKHPYKFYHPKKSPNLDKCPDQPPFIIIPHKVNHHQIKYILKELECWSYG